MDIPALLNTAYSKVDAQHLSTVLTGCITSNTPVVIGIEGASGSGKSTVAKSLLDEFTTDRMAYISLDDYVHLTKEEMNAQGIKTRYDWRSRDRKTILSDIALLRQGIAITKSIQDYLFEKPSEETEVVDPKEYILLDGNLNMSDFCDITVFLYADNATLLQRRIQRDSKKSIHSDGDTYRKAISKSLEYYHEYLEPHMGKADVIVNTVTNEIYKKHS